MDVNGFTHSYKKDEYIYGEKFNGKRWITTRDRCDLILKPAHFLRQHCQSGQTQTIIESGIWPQVAADLMQIASQSSADAYCLGFDEEQSEILSCPPRKLPLFVGREFKKKSTLKLLENRLKIQGGNNG